MVPTSLPELPKPFRTSGKSQTPMFEKTFYIEMRDKSFIILINPFFAPPHGQDGLDEQFDLKHRFYLHGIEAVA